MNEKLGILVFYVNVEHIVPEDKSVFLQTTLDILTPHNSNAPLGNWQSIVCPVYNQPSSIQVIRNDGLGLNTIELDSLKEQLEEILKIHQELLEFKNKCIELV